MGEGFWEEGGEEERRNKSQGKGGEAGRGWEERSNNEGRGREEKTEGEEGGQRPVGARPWVLWRHVALDALRAAGSVRTRRGDSVEGTSWHIHEYLNPLLRIPF